MVRVATEEDLPDIAELIEIYFDEVQQERNFPIDFKKDFVLAHLIGMMKDPNVIFLISGAGLIAGVIMETWFSGVKAGEEQIFYVRPDSRDGFSAKALLDSFTEEAKKRGAKGLFFTNFTGIGIDRFERFVCALGFKRQGGIYLKVFE